MSRGFVACICGVMAVGVLGGTSWEYKTDPKDPAEARAAGWQVIKGSNEVAPELSIVKKAAVGATAIRIEVKKKALYQGIELVDGIDLSRYWRMEFYIKQNIRTGGDPWPCTVQIHFEDGGYALATPLMGLGDWAKVVLPFNTKTWKIVNSPEGFKKVRKIRIYDRNLDTPGEFMMIDGLVFVPKD